MTNETTRERKTVDNTVSMRHIAGHVDALRQNNESDSKINNPAAYVNELQGVITASISMLTDLAYIMGRKGIEIKEDIIPKDKCITAEEARVKVFHSFGKKDFDIANKIRWYLNGGGQMLAQSQEEFEKSFTEEQLWLQFNILQQCIIDARTAKVIFSQAASKA